MAAGPKRRTVRLAHLNAGVTPAEQALLARAEVLAEQAETLGDKDPVGAMSGWLAAEFRALADEYHYWG